MTPTVDVAAGPPCGAVDLVGAEPDLHRAADLARVAPDVGAVPVEDRRRRGDVLGRATRGVPHVGVLRGEAQRALRPRPADPDRRVRTLHRLGLGDGVLQPVVLARRTWCAAASTARDHLQALLEPVGTVLAGAELEPQHGVLVLGPAGADAEVETPAGQVVDRDRHLRQHCRDAGRCCRPRRTRAGCGWSAAAIAASIVQVSKIGPSSRAPRVAKWSMTQQLSKPPSSARRHRSRSWSMVTSWLSLRPKRKEVISPVIPDAVAGTPARGEAGASVGERPELHHRQAVVEHAGPGRWRCRPRRAPDRGGGAPRGVGGARHLGQVLGDGFGHRTPDDELVSHSWPLPPSGTALVRCRLGRVDGGCAAVVVLDRVDLLDEPAPLFRVDRDPGLLQPVVERHPRSCRARRCTPTR